MFWIELAAFLYVVTTLAKPLKAAWRAGLRAGKKTWRDYEPPSKPPKPPDDPNIKYV